jgi:NAD(P)-dependent dehydrogenase (short-subunit alcohol dehydrogenase family)
MAVNLRAEVDLVKALLPALRAAGPGSAVVGIASIEALVGHGSITAYTSSKHGLLGLTRSLSHKLGPEGLRVNCVCPGYVETPMLARALTMPGARDRMEGQVSLKRLATPEDIAMAVRFLLSTQAAYVNGVALTVDGGWTASGGQ